MDPENGRSTPFWTSCERQRHGDFIAGTVVIQSCPNLFASDPKPEQERPAHVNLGRQRLAKEKLEEAPFTFPGTPLSAKMFGSVLPSNLLPSCSPGTTH